MKSFLYILNITLPVILLLAIGFLYGSKKKINPKTLTDIVLFLLAPALIFHTLSTRNLNIQNIFEHKNALVVGNDNYYPFNFKRTWVTGLKIDF